MTVYWTYIKSKKYDGTLWTTNDCDWNCLNSILVLSVSGVLHGDLNIAVFILKTVINYITDGCMCRHYA